MSIWDQQGLECFHTTSIDEAMDLILEKRPDFVMLAYDYPKYSEVISLKRAVEQNFGTDVIGFIESDSKAMVARLATSDLRYVINPPLDANTILRTLNKMLKENPDKYFRTEAKVTAESPATEKKTRKLGPDEMLVVNTEEELTSAIGDAIRHALDQFCKIDKNADRVQAVKEVTHLEVWPFQVKELGGYLVAVSGSDDKRGANAALWKDIVEYAQFWLKTKGIEATVHTPVRVEVEEVDFVSWCLSDAEFSKTAFHKEEEVAMAYFSEPLPLPEVKSAAKPDLLEVSLKDISTGLILDFDLLLYLKANDKLSVVVKSGAFLRGPQMEKLKEVGVKNLLIKKDDKDKYEHFVVSSRFKKLVEKYAFTNMNKELKRILGQKMEVERIKNEIMSAQGVQDMIFPEAHHLSDEIEVRGFFQRASECGGDWWYYIRKNNEMYLCIADATGHGLSAAMVTTAARSAATILNDFSNLPLPQIMGMLSNAIHGAGGGQVLMTFFLAHLNLTTGEMKFCNASHNAPLLFPNSVENYKKSDVVPIGDKVGPRLGEKANASYQEEKITLKPGDRVVFFTDGVIELEDPSGKIWGDRRFLQSLLHGFNSNGGITAPMHKLNRDMDEYRRDKDYPDDVTFFMIQYRPKARRIRRAA
jgi:serine phosphatase RsbU (regulator of sigma subunit)